MQSPPIKMKPENRPDVFHYHDLVNFLNDWFTFLRKTRSDFNARNFAQQSGVALGYMNMILSRQRPLSEKAFLKIIPHLSLASDEQTFLNLLRTLGQSEDSNSRLTALNEMMKFKKFKVTNKKENRAYEYLTKWYYAAIYEMFNLDSFQHDAKWIQRQLKKKVALSEVEQALSFLKDHNFVRQNSDGKWSQASAHVDCTEGIFKISLAEFHKQMLNLAHDSIHSANRDERYIMGQTMAISRENFDQIKQIIQQAIKQINEVNKNLSPKENVYQIEIAAFPLLHMSEEK